MRPASLRWPGTKPTLSRVCLPTFLPCFRPSCTVYVRRVFSTQQICLPAVGQPFLRRFGQFTPQVTIVVLALFWHLPGCFLPVPPVLCSFLLFFSALLPCFRLILNFRSIFSLSWLGSSLIAGHPGNQRHSCCNKVKYRPVCPPVPSQGWDACPPSQLYESMKATVVSVGYTHSGGRFIHCCVSVVLCPV